jgi:hypothetical protein
MANLTTYNALLKEFYGNFEVEVQINNEANVTQLFEKSTMEWGGRQLVCPVHVGRNTGVANIPDGGALPTAGNQVYADLILTAETIVGRAQISTKLMKSAAARGPRAFLGYMQGEINKLKDDVVNLADQRMISGGRFKGLFNEHKAFTDSVSNVYAGAGSVVQVQEYNGDFTPFLNVAAGNVNTWVRIQLYNMADYAEIATSGTNVSEGLFVSAIDQTARTITTRLIGYTAAAYVADTTMSSLPAAQTVSNVGYGVAVALHATQLQTDDAVPVNIGTITSFADEQNGILGNLCDPTHFNVDRTTATATNALLQSIIFTQATAAAAGNARANITPARIMRTQDEVALLGGKGTDCIILNPIMRSAYTGVLTATLEMQVKGKQTVGDMVPSKVEAFGQSLKTSQHCPVGLWFLLDSKTWKLCELARGDWMSEDGAILSRVSGFAAYEAVYEWHWNLLCKVPHCNAILCGMNIT